MKTDFQVDAQQSYSIRATEVEQRLLAALKKSSHSVRRFLLRGVPHQVDLSRSGSAPLLRQVGKSWVLLGDLLMPGRETISDDTRILDIQPSPSGRSLLVRSSRYGMDTATTQEVIIESMSLEAGHFQAPAGKGGLRWQDEDAVLAFIAADESELTHAGHPRIVRLWRRGEALKDAVVLAEVRSDAVTITAEPLDGGRAHLIMEQRASRRLWYVRSEHQIYDLGLPRGSQVWVGPGGVYASLANGRGRFKAQDLVYFPVAPNADVGCPELVLKHVVPVNVVPFDNGVAVVTTDDGEERLLRAFRNNGTWSLDYLGHWGGACNIVKAGQDQVAVSLSAPTTAPRTMVCRPGTIISGAAPQVQYRALGETGYHLCRSGAKAPGPTLVCVYGGFGAIVRPRYYPELDAGWCSLGCTLVLAHVRGGGERGAESSLSGMREGKIGAADDLGVIFQDLVDLGITTPSQLVCLGSSNGGLVTALACIRHPGLLRAAVLNNALLDLSSMERSEAGRGWVEEYGSWATDSAVMRSYSPIYQLPDDCRALPEFLICTQLNDDRINPCQARDFAAAVISRGGRAELIQGSGSHRGPMHCAAGADLLAKIFLFLHSIVTKEPKC